MQRVNVEGLYATVQAVLPHMKRQQSGGRIIVVSPPIYSRFFRGKTAYAMGKVGMSVLTKGLAMDFERQGLGDRMAITSIWPAVVSFSTLFWIWVLVSEFLTDCNRQSSPPLPTNSPKKTHLWLMIFGNRLSFPTVSWPCSGLRRQSSTVNSSWTRIS